MGLLVFLFFRVKPRGGYGANRVDVTERNKFVKVTATGGETTPSSRMHQRTSLLHISQPSEYRRHQGKSLVWLLLPQGALAAPDGGCLLDPRVPHPRLLTRQRHVTQMMCQKFLSVKGKRKKESRWRSEGSRTSHPDLSSVTNSFTGWIRFVDW